jgi:hypothetical protein
MSIRITCINKAGGYHEDPHEAIQTLGWQHEQDASTGRSTREVMHDWVKQGGQAFVVSGSHRAPLIALTNSRGTKYVKTKPDGVTDDNLLNLPECR